MSDQILNQKKILIFWLPQAASWALMTLEGPTIQATISRLPEATPVRPSREPAVGALLAALDRAGREYDPGAVDATLPAADLFGTHPRGLTPGPGYPVAPTVADVGRSASE